MLPALAALLRTVPKEPRTGWIVQPQAVEYTMKRQGDSFMPAPSDLAKLAREYSNCAIAKARQVSEPTIRKWLVRMRLERTIKPTQSGKPVPDDVVVDLRRRAIRSGLHRRPAVGRLTVEHVGRVIAQIGREANIKVRSTTKNGKPVAKYVSAHDLRRGCAQRLINAGVSAETLKVIMRHREFSTTEKYYGATRRTQSAASELVQKLSVGGTSSSLVGGLVGGNSRRPLAHPRTASEAKIFARNALAECSLLDSNQQPTD
ncbi:MAG: site-specific integrase [Pirellulales bacterium]|nr:site-specific integrase [Pirellulales bacterium]